VVRYLKKRVGGHLKKHLSKRLDQRLK